MSVGVGGLEKKEGFAAYRERLCSYVSVAEGGTFDMMAHSSGQDCERTMSSVIHFQKGL